MSIADKVFEIMTRRSKRSKAVGFVSEQHDPEPISLEPADPLPTDVETRLRPVNFESQVEAGRYTNRIAAIVGEQMLTEMHRGNDEFTDPKFREIDCEGYLDTQVDQARRRFGEPLF